MESGMVMMTLVSKIEYNHKVPRAGSRALPIHAKSGREWGPENARVAPAFGMT